MRKSIKSIMAFALAASLAASTLAPATTAAAASKQNVVTKATYDNGDTKKFTYNKNGLLKKVVTTNSKKESDSDNSTTTTTTYKYNKKNKITTKTTKTVNKYTTYETDKTTGIKLGAKKGTVTTTTTSVTKFTYNKKGLATQSVTTKTTGMSGSETTTSKSSITNENNELADGRIIAGYNRYNADGTEINPDDDSSANAFYYEGSLALTEAATTTTTTYTDKGNGSYTVTETETKNDAGYKTEPVKLYYGKITKDGAETIVPLAYSKDGFEGEREAYDGYDSESGQSKYKKVKYTYDYQTADGKDFFDYNAVPGNNKSTFSITQKEVITADPTNTGSSTTTSTDEITDKSVTTTKYTYDKKKRVKKAVATTVNTNETVTKTQYSGNSTNSYTYDSYYDTSAKKTITVNTAKKESYTDRSMTSSEDTDVTTTTYTYDKKGRAKKKVVSKAGVANSKSTSKGGFYTGGNVFTDDEFTCDHETYNSETTTTTSDGTTASTTISNKSYSFSGLNPAVAADAFYPTVTTTVSAGGTQTETATKDQFRLTFSESTTGKDSGWTQSGTIDKTFYGNGGSKTVKATTKSQTYTNAPTDNYTYENTTTSYQFDKNGKSNGYVRTEKTTYSDGSNPYTPDGDAHYTDGKDPVDGVAATAKIDTAKAALEATGAVYNKVDTKTLLATPRKETTKYSYDKSGNVKSAKSSGTEVKVANVKNETYGNDIYEFDAQGKLQVKQTVFTNKFTNKNAKENSIKKNTKVLTKQLTMNSNTYNRKKSSGYTLKERIVYSVKSKKANANAKKQQWIIQNGALNGEVGLD